MAAKQLQMTPRMAAKQQQETSPNADPAAASDVPEWWSGSCK